MSPGEPQSLQNCLQNGAWNHQIPEIVEKVKSTENHRIYHVFERLGHWKTDYFPFRIHQGIWLQCRSAFCDSKTQKVSKYPKVTANWPQLGPHNPSKIFKKQLWVPWGSPWMHPWHIWLTKSCQTGPKGPNVMPKWCQRGRRQGAEPFKSAALVHAQASRRVELGAPAARCPVHVHAHVHVHSL